ncbi:MAG TPA: aminotransferase class I/II-fold pyridoxal phosphate-dependent enzyme [Chitinophagaceae bacterium]|nr:aminotransferase class I/II-fold pyridoxal phosphate-dependent enzyme [Chitinophagaceae bacterium]
MAINRRKFLKSGSALLPALLPFSGATASDQEQFTNSDEVVNFYLDGRTFEPGEYLTELQKASASTSIERDRYGVGGAIEQLEKKFTAITGKEKAIFMPSGTMANQLAISVLSGQNAKVIVQDTSHVYRDEADAAQTVFNKRLVPLAKGETFFSLEDLQGYIKNLGREEVFESGIGAVSIENPVRRADGRYVPLEEIKRISEYCRANRIRLHLDGARLFLASAWTGVSIKEYASYFDTVYISLYKYLGASAGAILCGEKSVIDQMPHLIKVHGGSMYGNWVNAAMALNRVEGMEQRLKDSIQRADKIFAELNKLPGILIKPLQGGTNIYSLKLGKEIDGKKFRETLSKDYQILMPRLMENNEMLITVNETLLYRQAEYIINAFRKGI